MGGNGLVDEVGDKLGLRLGFSDFIIMNEEVGAALGADVGVRIIVGHNVGV